MIKVNLGRTRLDSIEIADGGANISSGPGLEIREIVVKLLILLLGVFSLMYYESQNLDALNSKMALAQSALAQQQAVLDQKNQEFSTLSGVESDAKALQDKLGLLKRLSRLRLREVKSLDYIQSAVPQKVWLTSLEMTDERLSIKGKAQGDTDVTLFMRRMESGGYFSDVILMQDSTITESGTNLREFEVSARMEAVN